MEELTTLARADGPYGEVVLRRRGSGDEAVHELIVNGTFAMDSAETSSERALARLPFPFAGKRVLLGGLGLGYTAEELLTQGVASLDVVELEPALVDWAHRRLTVVLGRVADDARVRLRIADIATVLARRDSSGGWDAGWDDGWDAIVLDVDNGPDFLIHPHNARLYSPDGLLLAFDRLRPGGLLAIWCQGPHPALLTALAALVRRPEQYQHRIRRGVREWSHVIYTAQRDPPPTTGP